MTNQEKKEFLQRYRAAEREEERLGREIGRWFSRAEQMTAGYGPAPVGGGDSRSLERAMEHIDELTRELTRRRDELTALRRQTGAAIDALPDPRLRELLRLRYIEGLTWERISVRMNYSYMQVCRLHGKALSELKM